LWSAYVHPDDLKIVSDGRSRALKSHESFAVEHRLRRDDGAYRWIFDVASPRLNGDGSFAGFIGSGVDVTDQRAARESLEKISGQLIALKRRKRVILRGSCMTIFVRGSPCSQVESRK
jgi:hypothetical protein